MSNVDETFPNQQGSGKERFESDTQKLMHRHLQDKDHVITEEELKSIRVGMAPAEKTKDAELNEDAGNELDKVAAPADSLLTPWNTIEPQST